jgi:hypothetical protein
MLRDFTNPDSSVKLLNASQNVNNPYTDSIIHRESSHKNINMDTVELLSLYTVLKHSQNRKS